MVEKLHRPTIFFSHACIKQSFCKIVRWNRRSQKKNYLIRGFSPHSPPPKYLKNSCSYEAHQIVEKMFQTQNTSKYFETKFTSHHNGPPPLSSAFEGVASNTNKQKVFTEFVTNELPKFYNNLVSFITCQIIHVFGFSEKFYLGIVWCRAKD